MIKEIFDESKGTYGNLYIGSSPVVVGVMITQTQKGNIISKIQTVHANRHALNEMTDDNILYLSENKKETKSWFQSLGKQELPLGGNKFGFIRSISQSNAFVNTKSKKNSETDESSYSYTPKGENGVDNYTEEQYNNFGWVRANNVINAGYWRNFTENFAQAVSGNYNYPKNKDGEFMIDVYDAYDSSGITDVIVFASGTIESPNITKIVKIDLTNDIDIETKRRNLYEAERRGIQQTTGELFIFYHKANFIGRFWNQRAGTQSVGNNHRLNTKRSRSEIKANRIVEFHIDEENGTVTTT